MDILRNLTEGEKENIKEAIPLITILIAGADGEIDTKETEWATKLTNIRSFSSKKELQDFYADVETDFESKLLALIESLPDETVDRTNLISQKLTDLNPVLAKLPSKIGAYLYDDFISFAKHIASASGGFLRFGAIDSNEKKLIPLSMIDPIEYADEEE